MRTRAWASWVAVGMIGAAGCSSHTGSGGGGSVSCPPPEPANHRASASVCPLHPTTLACTTDADCTGITTGKCASGLCVYDACTTDADCGSAGLCNCLGQPTPGGFGPLPQGNVCLAADCHVDADCGAGFFCALSPSTAVVPAGGYGCTTCEDECSSHNGCPGGTAAEPENYSLCAFDPAVKHWDCQLEPDAE